MSNNSSVVNVVASSDLNTEVDLNQLDEDMDSVSYDPDDFPGLVYRLDDPDVSTLIFRSGKLVATGADTREEARTAVDTVFSNMRDLGIELSEDYEAQIQNIVVSSDLESRLNLNAAAIGLGLENIEYEPEQFPGLIYRLEDPDVCVLLFGTGKVVVSGAVDPEDADVAIDRISDELDALDLLD